MENKNRNIMPKTFKIELTEDEISMVAYALREMGHTRSISAEMKLDRFQLGDPEDDMHFIVLDDDEAEREKADADYDLEKNDLV